MMNPQSQSDMPMHQSSLEQGQSGSEHEAVQQALNPDAIQAGESGDIMARDPVCGMQVNTRTATDTLASPVNDAMGTLYFCSPECKAIFEQDPQKYGYTF